MRNTFVAILFIFITLFLYSCGQDECVCIDNGQTITYTEKDTEDGDVPAACERLDALYKITSPESKCEMK